MALELTARPAQDDSREPVPVGGAVMTKLAEILRKRGTEPGQDDHTEDRPDSTEEYQQDVYRMAWRNSLALSGHADYARYRLNGLDDAQYPQHLKKYADQLAAVRRHNRAQRSLPPEQQTVKRPKVLNMILAGGIGAGKTVAAAALGAYAVEAGLMARFVSHTMYLAWLRPDGAPSGLTQVQVRERYERCDLLVVDDLCNEMDGYATNHVRTHTSDLLTARLNSGRATVFTTNLTYEQIAEVLGERFASRIGNRATVLKYEGEDRRKPQRW